MSAAPSVQQSPRAATRLPVEDLTHRLRVSYEVLDTVRLPNDLYLASPSADYGKVWLRDTFYEVLPYVNKDTPHYEHTYWRVLDILRKHEDKIDQAIEERPGHRDEYIHPRYHPETLDEFEEPWGNKQHDAVGAILFGIALGLDYGKNILRDEKDREVVQKCIHYLDAIEYWDNPDNGIWEENEEVHASSLGPCVAGLLALRDHGFRVPVPVTTKGKHALDELLPRESPEKRVDLALLTLCYPFYAVNERTAHRIVNRVERWLLRERGVIRYKGDSYYSPLEKKHGRGEPREFYHGSEAEWTFGLPWLSLAWRDLGDPEKADYYLQKTKYAQTKPGILPELFYAGTDKPNPNTPLGWSVAMHILALERAGAEPPLPVLEPVRTPHLGWS